MPANRPTRKTIPALIADLIQSKIASGEYAGELPGVRVLAKACATSVDSAKAALDILESTGILLPSAPGRRRLISKSTRNDSPLPTTLATCRFGVVLAAPLHELPAVDQHFIEPLLARLRRGGAVVQVFQTKAYTAKNPDRELKKMVHASAVDFWIVTGVSREMAEWFQSHRLPRFFLGGVGQGFGPRSGLRVDSLLRPVVEHLVALGHRRIIVPLDRLSHDDGPFGSGAVILKELARAGLPASDFNVPRYDKDGTSLAEVLEKCFAVTPPTAVILASLDGFVATMGFCMNRRLRIPQDVSLACLDSDEILEKWTVPAVTRVDLPLDKIHQRIVRFIERLLGTGAFDSCEALYEDHVLIPGETTGPPPKMT